MTSMRALTILFSLMALLASFVGPFQPIAAQEAPAVQVRGGEHEGFGRLVFDWPSRVGYDVQIDAQELRIVFDQAARFDISPLSRDLEDYIGKPALSADGQTLTVPLKKALGLKHFTIGPKVVVDLRDVAVAAPRAAAAGGASNAAALPKAKPAVSTPATETARTKKTASKDNRPSARPQYAANDASASDADKPISLVPTAPSDPPAPASIEGPLVPLRVGEHPGFGRLVFDWPGPVRYRAEQVPGRIVIRFEQPARFDLSRFRKDPPPPVRGLTTKPLPDGVAVEIAVPEGAKLRHYSDKGQVVIDVLGPAEPQTLDEPTDQVAATESLGAPTSLLPPRVKPEVPGKQPAKQVAEKKTSAKAAEKAPTAVKADKKKAAEKKTQTADAAKKQTNEKAVDKKPTAKAAEKKAAEKEPAAKAADQKPAAKQSAKKTEAKPAKHDTAAATEKGDHDGDASHGKAGKPARKDHAKGAAEAKHDPSASDPEATKSEAAKSGPAEPESLVSANHQAPLPPEQPVPGRAVNRDGGLTLRFNWAEPVAAAAFWRGDRLWLVFDRQAQANIATRISKVAPELGGVDQTTEDGATVIRMAPKRRLEVALEPDGNDWLVKLASETGAPSSEITLQPDRSGGQARLLVPLPSGGRLLRLDDPVMGDQIHVVPVTTPSLGMPRPRNYPEFRALASFQGFVLNALSDAVSVERSETGVVIAATGGLYMSNAKRIGGDARRLAAARSGRRLFDLDAWRRGDSKRFTPNRQKLQTAVVEAEGRKVSQARLELARFYYAHGMANEALGTLELMGRESTHVVQDPQVLLMKASGRFLNSDYLGAIEDLRHPALDGESEAFLWRAAAAAVDQNWADAVELFVAADTLIDDYPRAVRMRLRLLAAEARLGVSDTGGASQYLNQLLQEEPDKVEAASIDFLEGKRLLIDHETEAALDLWEKVGRGEHRASAARARLAMVEYRLEEGEITKLEAADELERIRFLWRGDDFEFAMLLRLAELYIDERRFRDGLLSLRQAASYLPNPARADAVTSRMRALFADLYVGKAAADLPPLRALAIYEEFKELTPAGAAGDDLIAHLADRLVEMDLLDQASLLLGQQVRYRLEGLDQARMGARVAALQLINDQPFDAIEILNDSELDEMPEGLDKERRHLKARALAEAGIADRALELLDGDQTHDARRLRAEILWTQERWAETAAELESLLPRDIPFDQTLDEDQASLVISLAVAFTLNADRGGLHRLDWDYREAMAGTPQAKTFAMLTSDLDTSGITSIRDELAGVDAIQAFMTGYRDRLEETALGSLN